MAVLGEELLATTKRCAIIIYEVRAVGLVIVTLFTLVITFS